MKNKIHFSQDQWAAVRENYENWWNKKSKEIIVGGIVKKYAPTTTAFVEPLISQWNVHLDVPTEKVLDSIEHELSCYEFYGDAFPHFNMDCFGPGVVAGFLGCDLINNNGETSVWFRPKEGFDIAKGEFEFDKNNPIYKRVLDIFQKGVDRFNGNVMLSMPDLGGISDILSSFLPSEEMLVMLYDDEELVKKKLAELDVLWQKYYNDFAAALKSDCFGYTDWSGILSYSKPSYIIQADFSYMISNDMFKEFIMPSLKFHCDTLPRTIYHLDGVGELKHLDDILSLANLNAVQWVAGAGNPPCEEWIDVYNKIKKADKLMQICWSGYESLERISKTLNCPGYLQHPSPIFALNDEDYVKKTISKLKAIR